MSNESSLFLLPSQLRHSDSAKWMHYEQDVLPLWVADMDFAIAPSIQTALIDRLNHGVGYHRFNDDPALLPLLKRKLQTQGMPTLPDKGAISFLSGVVAGLYAAVLGLTAPGDDVVTMTPIYPPFLSAITDHGRRARLVPLRDDGALWQIDFAALEAAITPATRVLMLCHPHNPTGRLWTPEELGKIAAIAQRHRLWIVSDELHADLTLEGTFVPFTAIASNDLLQRTVTLTGPCKAYNTAGLGIGAMISHNPDLITRLKRATAGVAGHAGALSFTMWRAALEDDGQWLARILSQLRANRDRLVDFVGNRLPGVRLSPPQATYLAWLDYSAHPQGGNIQDYLLKTAKVALNPGIAFGPDSASFVRLNFATSPAILDEALCRLAAAPQSG